MVSARVMGILIDIELIVVSTAGYMLISIGLVVRGFDGGIDGDINWFGRPWFRRRD